MILAFIILILNVGGIPRALSSSEPNFEEDYYAEILNTGFSLKNTLCDDTTMNVYNQIAVCDDLFQRFLYRSIWNVHLNKQTFSTLTTRTEACTKQKITWKKIEVELDWSPTLLVCYGQHRPIRTSHTRDDYFESFFLTSGERDTQMYLFQRTITVATQEIVLLAKYTVDIDRLRRTMTLITRPELQEESSLNTIETRNFDTAEIEMIYAVDIMQGSDEFDHPMHDMEKEHLITVCWSVFHDVSDLHHGAYIDQDGMFAADEVTKWRVVTFQFEIDLPQEAQLMYSCQMKHSSGQEIHNMAVRELFYVSPGRRPNSIFAYRQTGVPNFVKLIFYLENFDFTNLRPTHPSETEVTYFEFQTK